MRTFPSFFFFLGSVPPPGKEGKSGSTGDGKRNMVKEFCAVPFLVSSLVLVRDVSCQMGWAVLVGSEVASLPSVIFGGRKPYDFQGRGRFCRWVGGKANTHCTLNAASESSSRRRAHTRGKFSRCLLHTYEDGVCIHTKTCGTENPRFRR